MKAKDFDKKFDNDEDILDCLDLSKAKRVLQDQKESMLISRFGCLNHWIKKPVA